MKVFVIMFAFKKCIEIKGEERSGAIYRPDFMFISEFDIRTHRYTRRRIVFLKYGYIPKDIAEMLIDKNSVIVMWDKDGKAILHTLIQEAGYNCGKLRLAALRRFLSEHGIPHSSLSSAAKELHLKTCPRDGVQTISKIGCRFDTLRKVFKTAFIISRLNLIDGILI